MTTHTDDIMADQSADETPHGEHQDHEQPAPRRRPGPKPDPSRPRSRARARAAAGSGAPSPKPRTKKAQTPDYAAAIQRTIGTIMAPAAAYAATVGNWAVMADCIAVAESSPALGEWGAQWAQQSPAMAMWLDRMAAVEPLTQGATIVLGLMAQFAVNHGKLRAGMVPGTRDIVAEITAAEDKPREHPTAA